MNNVKINELRQWMAQHQVELAYISDPGHIAYFSGYESDPHERVLALFIPLEQDPFLFTPALEVEDAQNSSWAYDVRGYLDSENPWEISVRIRSRQDIRDSIEAIDSQSILFNTYITRLPIACAKLFSDDLPRIFAV